MSDAPDFGAENGSLANRRGCLWPRWIFLLLGLALGLAVGLGYTWGLNPVQFYNTDPVDLRPEHKDTWTMLVAAGYRRDGNLDRALYRLAGLDDPRIGHSVAQLTERYIQSGKPATRIRALAVLADALGARTDAMIIYLATPEPTLFFTPTPPPPTATSTPTPTVVSPTPRSTATPTATATRTPIPSRTPSPTPTVRPTVTRRPTPTHPPPYVLQERQRICQPDRETPRIEIVVQTKEGSGIPGSEVWITGAGGAERFYTGLKPELGLGYADFDMSPGVIYALAIGDPNQPLATDLSAEPCHPSESDSSLTSWRLVIVAQPGVLTPTPSPTPLPSTPAISIPTSGTQAAPTSQAQASGTPTPTPVSTRILP